VNDLSKKDKQVAPAKPRENTSWSETFDGSDHNHFIKMSAEAMQEAMNIASAEGDVEKMLAVAGHWGTLAATLRDLQRGKAPLGFTNKEDNKDG
jgi:hypothetical protein